MHKKSKKIKLYLLFITVFCLPLFYFSKKTEHTIRAAIDIGSGATKLKVAKINLKTQKIEKVLIDESFPVQYQEELEKSPHGNFNEEVMDTGLRALKQSQEIAEKYGAKKVVAVATASFRKAANAQEFIDKIYDETGIRVYTIDQQLEGVLGFQAASAQLKANPKDIVVWDIGGGSYQFATLDEKGDVLVYRGLDASIPFKNHVIQSIKKKNPTKTSTPNPLSFKELQKAKGDAQEISKKVDSLFKEKIADPNTKVVGIGNIFAYGIYPLVGKATSFSQDLLMEEVHKLAGKTDQDLGKDPYVNVAVTNPTLVLGFMNTLGIQQMDILNVNNADGALVYPAFWDKEAASSFQEKG